MANHVLRNGRIVHTYQGAETPGMFQTRAQAARFFLGLIAVPIIKEGRASLRRVI